VRSRDGLRRRDAAETEKIMQLGRTKSRTCKQASECDEKRVHMVQGRSRRWGVQNWSLLVADQVATAGELEAFQGVGRGLSVGCSPELGCLWSILVPNLVVAAVGTTVTIHNFEQLQQPKC
jgi:hypothetical protein